MNWNLRYASGTVAESGIDFGRAGHCTGPGCGFCQHLDEVHETKKSTGDGKKMDSQSKKHVEIIKKVRKLHQSLGKGTK